MAGANVTSFVTIEKAKGKGKREKANGSMTSTISLLSLNSLFLIAATAAISSSSYPEICQWRLLLPGYSWRISGCEEDDTAALIRDAGSEIHDTGCRSERSRDPEMSGTPDI